MRLFLSSLAVLTSFVGNASEMELLISAQEISTKIKEVAHTLDHDYQDKKLTVVMIMKGAICVTSDLIREINIPFELEYVKASSYGSNGMTGGKLTIQGLDDLILEGKDVLLVDDIFETGNTISGVMEEIKKKNPRSIKTLMLLLKDVPRKTDYRPDYVLFEIPDRFVIGYGLDYKEYYRGLPGIFAFINDEPPF